MDILVRATEIGPLFQESCVQWGQRDLDQLVVACVREYDYGRASKTLLKGVWVALLNRLKPPREAMSCSFESPA